jgi:hypothetical protein
MIARNGGLPEIEVRRSTAPADSRVVAEKKRENPGG